MEITKEINTEVINTSKMALDLKVVDNNTYLQAGEFLILFKELRKKIEAFFDPHCDRAHKTWKALTEARAKEIDKLRPPIEHLNAQMVKWNILQEQKRQEEEARLRREAEKVEEERRLQMAIEAEQAGAKEEAEVILTEPVFILPPIVEKTIPKIGGQAMVTTWKWRLIDINLVPRQYLQVNETVINQVVRAMKSATNIPGIEVYPESSMRGVRK